MFINLTPHSITIKNDNINLTLPSHGVARIKVEQKQVFNIDGVDFFSNEYKDLDINFAFLDEKVKEAGGDVYVIVSSLLLSYLRENKIDFNHRIKFCSPDTGATAERIDGRVVSVRNLILAN